MNSQTYMHQLGVQARQASTIISKASSINKNNALIAIADAIAKNKQQILEANQKDLTAAQGKIDAAMLDRLTITEATIQGMIASLKQVAELADPVGSISNLRSQNSGIQVGKMRVSLGVIGMIYESRPNVTCDAASLCLKSGNAVILRGGSEAVHSNQAIYQCIQQGLTAAGLPEATVQLVETTDRQAVGELISMPEFVDIIIPRGGKSLIERISKGATVPVIKHLDGICHVYIDDYADYDQAIAIAYNSKTHRYGVCNAIETLLVHINRAKDVLPQLADKYIKKGVELRGCARTCAMLPEIKAATADDWTTEYLAPILSIRIVDDLDQAIDHINTYGSHHTDTIVTTNLAHSQRFLREVDSSSVMVNTATRFADGFEYGLGAEIGISTDKIHTRGPVGLEGLTCEKYIVMSDGLVR